VKPEDSSDSVKDIQDEVLDSEQVIKEVDQEVKRVADLFRFILKYKRQFQPAGIEFSDLREYMPSDDASRIDWKASARTNDLYVKEYEVEQDTDTFILLDASDTMTFGTAEKLKSEYAAVMAATLAYASVDNGLNVGLGMYGDDSQIMTPEKGETQYQAILTQVTKQENYGGTFDLKQALEDVMGRIKSNTTIFVISDFIESGEDWMGNMKLANSNFRHMLCCMVRDRRDYKLPESGNIRFESPDGSMEMVANTNSIKEEFNQEAEKQEQQIKKLIKSAGPNFLKIDTRDSFAAEMASYFDQNGGANW